MTMSSTLPSDNIEQFEKERAAQREAQHIVLTWLQAIATAHRTGEELALLGYSVEGMDIALAGVKLESNPPVEYLQRLIDCRHGPGTDEMSDDTFCQLL